MSIHTGTIVRGQGDAQQNYKVMIPKIAEHYPAVSKCDQFGTINVRLDEPLDNSHADCWTRQILWSPVTGLEKNRLEAFGFIKIKFEYPCGGQRYDAWIILPEGHPWTYDGGGAEIVADVRIPDVEYGRHCALHLDHNPSSPRPDRLGEGYGVRTGRVSGAG